MEDRLIAIGQITSAHGVQGAVNVWPLSDTPGRYQNLKQALLGEDHRLVKIKYVGRKDRLVMLQIEGVTNADQVAALKGQYLRVPVSDVPPAQPGNPYIFQLIGQPVLDPEGNPLGTVEAVEEGASYNLLVVRTPAHGSRRVPIVDAFVKRLESEPPVVVAPIPGLLEDLE